MDMAETGAVLTSLPVPVPGPSLGPPGLCQPVLVPASRPLHQPLQETHEPEGDVLHLQLLCDERLYRVHPLYRIHSAGSALPKHSQEESSYHANNC